MGQYLAPQGSQVPAPELLPWCFQVTLVSLLCLQEPALPRGSRWHQADHESPLAGWKHSWTEEPSGQAESLGLAGDSWNLWLQAGWCQHVG